MTQVLENLSEDEAYLFALLSDPSGLDQAEFLWVDHSSEDNKFCPQCGTARDGVHLEEHGDVEPKDWVEKYPSPSGCFRAWAYQWPWWRSSAALQIDQCARSVGKSLSIKVRGCAFPFLFPGQEMIITAPELVHLEPIVSLIESQMTSTRTLSELLPRGRSSVTHRPFQMNFLNGARIIGRIPQRDGKGVKGIHPIWLELDEAQDYPHAGWVELNETLKRGFTGAMWRAHGVTKGVRDDFYEITQDTPDNRWKVHRFAAMWRPNWTDQEREEAIQKYGSREDPDYRRNVLGLHGDKTNPIFVLTQLMKNVDNEPLSDYNSGEYFKQIIKSENLELFRQDITEVLDFPAGHLSYSGKNPRQRAAQPQAIYWVGMDVGFTIDPSEILVFVEYRPKANSSATQLRLLSRISLVRMPHREQIQAILHTIDYYRPKAFSLDKGGLGLPLFQEMQEHLAAFKARDMDRLPAWMHTYDLQAALTTIKGYNFSEKLLVDIDQSVELSPYDGQEEIASKAGLKRNAKEYSTDVLREMVDRQQLWLPWDDDLLKQFQGGTWSSNRSMDAYGRRTFSQGNDHCVAAGTPVATPQGERPIEEIRAGDLVLTRSGPRQVLRAWQTSPQAEVLTISTDAGQAVTLTPDHPVLTPRGWVLAGEVAMAGQVITYAPRCSSSTASDSAPARVVGVQRHERAAAVYDLTVETDHEFIAGGIVVHNCLDAARMMALGWAQFSIEEMMRKPAQQPVLDAVISF